MKIIKAKMFIILSGMFLNSEMNAQKGAMVTETFSVSGNCGMCKKTIETAASVKGVKNVTWDESKKLMEVKYDKQKTSPETILRSVAYAGYDNEKYLAPKSAYEKLHGCCQYDRKENATTATATAKHENHEATGETKHTDHSPATETKSEKQETQVKDSGIKVVYDGYFQIKDALVKSNAASSAESAKKLLVSVDAINMAAFKSKEHEAYMKYVNKIKSDAKTIADNKNIEKQRATFSTLSESMYELMQEVKPGYEVYLDHCPMYNDGKGADWISKEKPIKNPYFGSNMLTCGNIKATIK